MARSFLRRRLAPERATKPSTKPLEEEPKEKARRRPPGFPTDAPFSASRSDFFESERVEVNSRRVGVARERDRVHDRRLVRRQEVVLIRLRLNDSRGERGRRDVDRLEVRDAFGRRRAAELE